MKRTLVAVFILLLSSANSLHAADASLVAAAKKEGEVVWYTTSVVDEVPRPIAAAFEKLYGIKIEINRSDPAELAIKILNEDAAGRPQADVFDGTTTVVPLEKKGFVLKWLPGAATDFPPEYKDPNGFWIAEHVNIMALGFNTQLVRKESEPHNYQDLLDPKWRGKMAWNAVPALPAAAGFIGAVLAEMGEEKGMAYLKQLATQNITPLQGSARAALDQVIAGEYEIGLQIFANHVLISRKAGAPVDWTKIEPTAVSASVISVNKFAPHLNAAKLLVEFIASAEGQKVLRDEGNFPANPAVHPLEPSLDPKVGNFRIRFFTPEQSQNDMPKWKKIFDSLFR